MNVSIIVFSPSGHTLKAAEIIRESLVNKDNKSRLLNFTKRTDLLYGDSIAENLSKELGSYDLLFIGGPLYAGHVEHNVLKIIESLPLPDKEHSCLAVPFVTYGGVHSSIALEEMSRHLRNKGYKSILGIKIAAEHSLTKTYSKVIYKNKPGDEEKVIIEKGVSKALLIAEKQGNKAKDQYKAFKYAPAKERAMFRAFSQEKFHKDFKNVSVIEDNCIRCQKCIKVCPVDMFAFEDEKIIMQRDKDNCILCAECFHNCPAGAIFHPYIAKAKERLKDGNAGLESPASAIYPET
ncbi:MAG: EFR1 family ferrodoxin [Spirochaetales bacterium]|nr:EFR1 family ferrodoxin [Spirochaetales bacterium]